MNEKNHETHSDHLEEEIRQKLGQITARANKEEDDRQARCDRLEEEIKQELDQITARANKEEDNRQARRDRLEEEIKQELRQIKGDFQAEFGQAREDFREMKQEIGDFAAVTSSMAKDGLKKFSNFLKKR